MIDAVAVVVDPHLEVAQSEGTLVAQDGAAEGAQRAAAHRPGVGLSGRDRALVLLRRAASLLLGDHRPEPLSGPIDGLEGVEAQAGQAVDLGVDLADPVEQFVALELEACPFRPGQAGPSSVREEPDAGGWRRRGR